MERMIYFNEGLVDGEDRRKIEGIIPKLKNKFRQRKNYDEYYFDPIKVEVNANQLDRLSKWLPIEISYNGITIKN